LSREHVDICALFKGHASTVVLITGCAVVGIAYHHAARRALIEQPAVARVGE
jgi:hypothetical protein